MPVAPVRHDFECGDILVAVVDDKRLSQWYVQEVLSPNRLRAVAVNEEGFLSKKGRVFEGMPLLKLMKDPLATRLFKRYNEEKKDPRNTDDSIVTAES